MKKHLSRPAYSAGRRKFLINTAQAAVAITIIPRYVMGGKNYVAPSDQINLGFIGTGKQGRGLVRNFATRAQVVAAADVDQQKLDLFQSNTKKLYADAKEKTDYKGITGYKDFRELLDRKDIDAVVIATPDHWHAVTTVMAAKKGKHVYCEKPLAHSIEEGRAMVNATKKHKVVLQTGSMQRSRESFRRACELVRNGYVGDVKEVQVNVGVAAVPATLPQQPVPSVLDWDMWSGPAPLVPFNADYAPPVELDIFPNWRKYKEYGGGILSDWGAHMFDIAQWGLGMDESGPVHFYPPDGKNYEHLTMVYKNGVVMKHMDFGRGFGVRFIGSKGTLDISREYLTSDPANIVTATIQPNETRLYKSDDHYSDWLNAIKNGTDPICNAETGHRTSSLCCIANMAYWLNRPLEWNPEKEKFRHDKEANRLAKANIRRPWSLD